MSGYSIRFGEEIKKLCQKMCSVRMLIWSADEHQKPIGVIQINYIAWNLHNG